MSLPSLYSAVARFAGCVLLVAGVLKSVVTFTSTPGTVQVSAILVECFEILLGAWLILGFAPRWSRIVGLVVFTFLLEVAVTGVVQGHGDCGCFGILPVKAYTAAALDAVIVLGLLFCAPPQADARPEHFRTVRRALFAAVTTGCGVMALWLANYRVVVRPIVVPDTVAMEDAAETPSGLTARVIDGLERNHAALPNLVYTHEFDCNDRLTPLNKSTPIDIHQHSSNRTVFRGDFLRRECRSVDETPGEPRIAREHVYVWRDGIRFETYHEEPIIQQATLQTTTPEVACASGADFRCAGFWGPITNTAALLRNANVLSVATAADRLGRKAVRMRFTVTNRPPAVDELIADFVPEQGYLPSRVVYLYSPTGGVSTVHDIDYSWLTPAGAWFPKTIKRRGYVRGTTDDPDAKGFNASTVIEVTSCTVGGEISDSEFDVLVPANSHMLGDLAPFGDSPDKPILASKLMLPQPRPYNPPKPQPEPPNRWWLLSLGGNSVLSLTCVCFRKQLRL